MKQRKSVFETVESKNVNIFTGNMTNNQSKLSFNPLIGNWQNISAEQLFILCSQKVSTHLHSSTTGSQPLETLFMQVCYVEVMPVDDHDSFLHASHC